MIRIGTIVLLTACTAGCVSAVSDSLEGAPEWFEARQSEIAGADYPSFDSAAKLNAEDEAPPWKRIRVDLTVAKAEIDKADIEPGSVTEAEMRAWAAEQKALVAKGEEPY